ncbi:hypothetical protein AAMO2058_000749700 [Amorphochlora amoebiformis]
MVVFKAVLALLLGASLAMTFVLSLYIWKNDKDRDHSDTIRKRFISMGLCCVVSPIPLFVFIRAYDIQANTFQWLGVTLEGLPSALVIPLALTAMLFLGPLVDNFILHPESGYSQPLDLRNVRNYVVAPLAEELVFRACICSLLVLGGWSHGFAGIVGPLMFGFAHLHHVLEHMRHAGHGLNKALQIAGFQTCYTTLFGMYASFLFLRTGHLIAPFLSHAFCNYMGLPEVRNLTKSPYKVLLRFSYITGILGFIVGIYPLTNPNWYNPHIWYYQ